MLSISKIKKYTQDLIKPCLPTLSDYMPYIFETKMQSEFKNNINKALEEVYGNQDIKITTSDLYHMVQNKETKNVLAIIRAVAPEKADLVYAHYIIDQFVNSRYDYLEENCQNVMFHIVNWDLCRDLCNGNNINAYVPERLNKINKLKETIDNNCYDNKICPTFPPRIGFIDADDYVGIAKLIDTEFPEIGPNSQDIMHFVHGDCDNLHHMF